MRIVATQEQKQISGAGEITEYYFDLKVGVEVIGFRQELIGYESVTYVEHGYWKDYVTVIQTPQYIIAPIYAETVTMVNW